MYYKATVSITTEQIDPDGGCNPDSFQDHGIVQTFEKPTLEALKAEIEKHYFSLSNPIGADVQIFDGAIEIQYGGEHHYSTPKAEQIPFIETARIVISRVEETYLDLASEPLFSSINRE